MTEPAVPVDVLGDAVELLVAERLDLELVDVDDHWHDAHSPATGPVEIKGCSSWTSNGNGRTAGRWWIQRGNHDQLLEAGGAYAMVVYELVDVHAIDDDPDPDDVVDHLRIHHLAVLPATFVDEEIAGWSATGPNHTGGAARQAKLSWTRVFDDHRDVPTPGGEAA